MKRESQFQRELKKKIREKFPGCYIFKNDPNDQQGLPDLLILHGDKWAALECKRSEDAPFQPNQEWHIDKMNAMSFATTIYPENEEEVLNALQSAL